MVRSRSSGTSVGIHIRIRLTSRRSSRSLTRNHSSSHIRSGSRSLLRSRGINIRSNSAVPCRMPLLKRGQAHLPELPLV
jgi:hypothetical protein